MTKIQVNAQGKAYIANGKALIAKEGGGAEGLWDRYLPILPDDNKPILVNVYSDEIILPAEFDRLEYLESSGTQYIDTEIIPDDTTGYLLEASMNNVSQDLFRFGCRQTSGGDTRFVLNTSRNLINIGWDRSISLGVSISADERVLYDVNYKNSRKYNVKNSEGSLPTLETIFTYSIIMFGRNSAGTITASAQKVYACQISKSQEIVRYFIPVKRKSNNELGMYDTVTGTFKTNAGTGTFTGGSVVAPLYQSKAVEDIGYDRSQTNVFGYYKGTSNVFTLVSTLTGTRIKKVEYLKTGEGSGVPTQYIDLGMKFTDKTYVYNEFASCYNSIDFSQIFGCFVSSSDSRNFNYAFAMQTASTNIRFSNQYVSGPIVADNNFHTAELSSDGAFYDDTRLSTWTPVSAFETPQNATLFKAVGSGSTRNQAHRKLIVKENDELVRDMISVRVDTTAYMLDQVEWKLYANAGTGAFIVGPDL